MKKINFILIIAISLIVSGVTILSTINTNRNIKSIRNEEVIVSNMKREREEETYTSNNDETLIKIGSVESDITINDNSKVKDNILAEQGDGITVYNEHSYNLNGFLSTHLLVGRHNPLNTKVNKASIGEVVTIISDNEEFIYKVEKIEYDGTNLPENEQADVIYGTTPYNLTIQAHNESLDAETILYLKLI